MTKEWWRVQLILNNILKHNTFGEELLLKSNMKEDLHENYNDLRVTLIHYTVRLEIFTRVLCSRNFAYAKFRENKPLVKWQDQYVVD